MFTFQDPAIYFHTREGPSQLSPVWRGRPFPAILSIGVETGSIYREYDLGLDRPYGGMLLSRSVGEH